MTTLVQLLAQAQDVGLTITRDGSGIHVSGPRSAEPLVRALQDRRHEVLTVVDYLSGASAALDWKAATLIDRPHSGHKCVLCGHRALLRDPYDNQPTHKTCAEKALRASERTEDRP